MTDRHASMRGVGYQSGETVTGSWRSLGGALCLPEQLGGVSWRTCLADLFGGVGLWRCGIEPRLIGTLRCDDQQATDRVRCSPAVGALWLALSDWLRNLAVSVGGSVWRTSLAVSPVAVRV